MPCPPPGDLSNSGIEPRSPALQADSLAPEPPGKPKNTGVGGPSFFQGVFPTQESNHSLLHCRQILYQLKNAHMSSQISQIRPTNISEGFFFPHFLPFFCLFHLHWTLSYWSSTANMWIRHHQPTIFHLAPPLSPSGIPLQRGETAFVLQSPERDLRTGKPGMLQSMGL